MLHLKLVEDSGFRDRKPTYSLDTPTLDPNFDGLLHRFFEFPFAYTFESCYGIFNRRTEGRERHVLGYEDSWKGIYEEGFVNFGLDTTPEAREFFERLKSIIRANRKYTHLAHSYPLHYDGGNLKPNEFHFGVMPSNGIPQIDGARIKSWEKAKEFEVIRNRIWKELDQLIRGYS